VIFNSARLVREVKVEHFHPEPVNITADAACNHGATGQLAPKKLKHCCVKVAQFPEEDVPLIPKPLKYF
jgi:hypothetical protein